MIKRKLSLLLLFVILYSFALLTALGSPLHSTAASPESMASSTPIHLGISSLNHWYCKYYTHVSSTCILTPTKVINTVDANTFNLNTFQSITTPTVSTPKGSTPKGSNTPIAPPPPVVEDKERLNELYVVQSGDTLYSIARRYGISGSQIASFNGISNPSLIRPGQQLRIPSSAHASPAIVLDNTPVAGSYGPRYYSVGSDDTLSGIAARIGVSVEELKRRNGLQSSEIYVGQQLIIPEPERDSEVTYSVRSGDSLNRIANFYNVSVSAIMRRNNLPSTTIIVGQRLIIPKPGPTVTPTAPPPPIVTPYFD